MRGALIGATAIIAASASFTHAQCHQQWQSAFQSGGFTNGEVLTMRGWGMNLAVGGTFTQFIRNGAPVTAPRLAIWRQNDSGVYEWQHLDTLGAGASGPVRAMELYCGLVVAGSFGQVGSHLRNGVARITADGTVHAMGGSSLPFPNAPNVDVFSLWRHDNRLYAGGKFSGISGLVYTLAVWQPDDPNGPLCVDDQLPPGQWVALDIGESRTIRAMTTYQDMLVVGREDGGVYALHNGSIFRLGQTLNGPVNALAVHNGTLFAGGDFVGSYGQFPDVTFFWRLARFESGNWAPFGGSVLGALSGGPDPVVHTLASAGNRLIVGGRFARVSSPAGTHNYQNVAAWTGSDWQPIQASNDEFGAGTNAPVHVARLIGTDLLFGGGFTLVGATSRQRIARFRHCFDASPSVDLDGNWVVDLGDLVEVLGSWGPCASTICPADLTFDGHVGLADLLTILAHWGPIPIDPDSCLSRCGQQAPGGCWCDDLCVFYGDCCDDACAACDECP